MGKKLHLDPRAEREATDIGAAFMHSSDVVGDMSRAYGRDLSSVRIHTGEDAARSAAERGVDAFSTGRDIFFGRNAFHPRDPASRGLLAHELAHSLQQGVGGSGAAVRSTPAGAAQGGLLDWFRSKFRRTRQPEPEWTISGPRGLEKNTSEESLRYMAAMEPYMRKDRINGTPVPAPQIGKGGERDSVAAFYAALQGGGGNPSFIQKSNEVLRDGGRSHALVNLGIRQSTDAPALADKAMRGTIYDGLSQDYADWIYRLQEGGLDTASMMQDETVRSSFLSNGEKLAYATGSGFDALNSKAMDMFSQYILSDASLDYIQNFSNGVAPAEVFGGSLYGLTGATGFALQTLVNIVGGNISQAAVDTRLSGDSRRVAVNMGRTIGSLPKMASVPEEELPPSLRPLRTRYIQLQQELDRRLRERTAAR